VAPATGLPLASLTVPEQRTGGASALLKVCPAALSVDGAIAATPRRSVAAGTGRILQVIFIKTIP